MGIQNSNLEDKGIVMMDLRIRSAEVDDAAFLAWLILTAGRGHVKRGIWEVVLEESEARCLKFLELLALNFWNNDTFRATS